MKFIEFESERLIFRKFREDDFPVVYSWHRDAENMSYRHDGVKTEEATREHLRGIIAEANADERESYWFAVVRKADNRLIGEGILLHIPEKPEVGWLVDKNFWRQGYGEEIGRALIGYCFGTLNLRRVIAACHSENHASYKLMEKIGMRYEGCYVKERLYGDEWCDRLQYAILREEWEHIRRCGVAVETVTPETAATDITFEVDGGYFIHGVRAIILHENHVLMVKNDRFPLYYPVGGRVQFGESSREAVLREALEETSLNFEIARLAFIHEHFFYNEVYGKPVHEIFMYYLMEPHADIENARCSSLAFGNVRETLHRLPVDKLHGYDIAPEFFKTELQNLTNEVKHFITKDEKTVRA